MVRTMKQNHTKHVYFSFFQNPLKVTGEFEIESLGWVRWGELVRNDVFF